MSIKAMNWAWEQQLPPPAKLILMALADAANEESRCWPRVKTIAAKCCVSDRTVQRVLRDFESNGLVTVTKRFIPGRGQTSNSYRLGNGSPPDKLAPRASHHPQGDNGDATPVTKHRRRGDDIDASYQEPKQNQRTESPLQPKDALESATSNLRLPRSLSNAELEELRALLANVPSTDAQVLLDELIGAIGGGNTIKTTPLRWFRAIVKRYEDGRFAPNIALDVARGRQRQDEYRRPRATCHRLPASPDVVSKHLADMKEFFRTDS